MNSDQTQLFSMEYGTRCDIFGCNESGEYMVGRPDGPMNMNLVICGDCAKSLVESVKTTFDMHEKAVHGYKGEPGEPGEPANVPFDDTEHVISLQDVIENIRTHAEVDEFAEKNHLHGIPTKDEGAKLQERKDAMAKLLKEL